MAGHRIETASGVVFVDYDDDEGAAIVNGREWRWSFHEYCGPFWLRKDGEPRKCQVPASREVWAAFDAWLKKRDADKAKSSLETLNSLNETPPAYAARIADGAGK